MQVVCNCIAFAMQLPICIIVVYSIYRVVSLRVRLLYIKRANVSSQSRRQVLQNGPAFVSWPPQQTTTRP